MSKRSKNKSKYKRPRNYFMLDHRLLDHPQIQSLSHAAFHLLIDMCKQFNGFNNGDIEITFKTMKQRGWNSSGTLDKARKELIATDWIRITRQGTRYGDCHLYALSWIPLNENEKLDITSIGYGIRDLKI